MSFADSLARGRTALQAGDFAGAAALFERCLHAAPAAVDGWFLLGAARHRLQDLAAARAAFRKAADLDPLHLQSRFALAAVCVQLADADEALAASREALAIAPDDARSWFGLAVAQEAGRQFDAALASYAQALCRDPQHADSLRNSGLLLRASGRLDEAGRHFQRLLRIRPDDADTWFALADNALAQERYAAAAEAFSGALRLAPDAAPVLLRAGFALAQCERFPEAQALLDRAAAIAPAQVAACRRSIFGADDEARPATLDARVLYLLRHFDAVERCDWRGRAEFVDRFRSLIASDDLPPLAERALGFRALAIGLDPPIQSRLAGNIADAVRRAAGDAALRPAPTEQSGRLRIGYLSGDFRNHATASLMSRLPALHDRHRFAVFLYSTGPGDGSALRRCIVAGADRFHDASADDDATLSRRIVADGIDILVDLAGYTDHSRPRVLALRPAPLQVAYLGYLQTSGAPWVDYALADRHVLPPELRRHWRERIAFLPHTLFICDDGALPLAAAGPRAAYDLPDQAFVFCCLNASWKVDPDTFACWMEILTRVPHALLWLYATSEAVAANLRRAACAAGIADDRLVFARREPHERHRARFVHADVFLDTFVCNAHTTAIEALAAGLPVVTLPGSTPAARVGAGLLAAHGLGDLIAESREDYVRIACRLADDADYLAAVGRRVAGRGGSRLFCTERRVREIESAFETMWARYRAGLPAADFDVPDLRLPEPAAGGERWR